MENTASEFLSEILGPEVAAELLKPVRCGRQQQLKTYTTIRLDVAVLEAFKSMGKGWQYAPRNHKIEQVIEAGLRGDFSLFHEMNEVLKKPYEEQEEFSSYKLAPRPEQVVQATFCGT